MSSPEQIQTEIERTRANLSNDVDRLSEKVAPGKVLGRRVDSVKSGVTSMRDKVMGSADDGNGLRGAGDTVSSKASELTSAAGSAPQAVRQQTQGNPLAVGLIAFGVGMLLSSLAPASQAEQNLAETAEAKAKELAEPLKQTGQEMAENLKQPVQESVQQVKETATDAAQDTADHAKSAAQDVKEPLQQ
jgi:F0F1-type ATP synthase membrane subunit b/b'